MSDVTDDLVGHDDKPVWPYSSHWKHSVSVFRIEGCEVRSGLSQKDVCWLHFLGWWWGDGSWVNDPKYKKKCYA